MKAGAIFWGTALIAVGVLMVLHMTGAIDGLPFSIWAWWPVLLILAGLAILSRSPGLRQVLAAVAGVAAALLVFDIFTLGFIFGHGVPTRAATSQEFSQRIVPGTERATLRVEGGAMKLAVDGTTDDLVRAETRSSHGEFTFSCTGDSIAPEVLVGWESTGGVKRIDRLQNSATIMLNATPVWDVAVEAGASSIDLDLTPFRVREVRLESGAASVKLALGDLQEEARVDIDAGVSSIELRVPESAGCEVRIDGGMSSKRMGGLEKVEDGVYRTAGFEDAGRKIYVTADVGLSSFRVRRD